MAFARFGFTLIEISIVLIIIGLIVGGVLAGQTLIENATNYKIINTIRSIQTAGGAFKLKYSCLPGDCSNATNFGFLNNGNGNGQYDDTNEGGPYFWENLSKAGLWAGNYTGAAGNYVPGITVPSWEFFDRYSSNLVNGTNQVSAHVVNGYFCLPNTIIGCESWRLPNQFPFGQLNTTGTNRIVISQYWTVPGIPFIANGAGLLCENSYVIDSKIDDGKPLTGQVRSIGYFGPYASCGCTDLAQNAAGNTQQDYFIGWVGCSGKQSGAPLAIEFGL